MVVQSLFIIVLFVRTKGIEPPRLSAPDPKSGAATITPRPQNWVCKGIDFLPYKKIPGGKSQDEENKATSEV